MNRNWTPNSQVSVTDAGMVIKIELTGIRTGSTRMTFKEDQLCIHGQHEDFGSFESRFEIPVGYSRRRLKVIFLKDVIRIDIPPGKDVSFLEEFPKTMLIYCNGCGKHFDIVITGKGPGNYPCPACGKIQVFDLETLISKVIEQSKNMLGKKRGRR